MMKSKKLLVLATGALLLAGCGNSSLGSSIESFASSVESSVIESSSSSESVLDSTIDSSTSSIDVSSNIESSSVSSKEEELYSSEGVYSSFTRTSGSFDTTQTGVKATLDNTLLLANGGILKKGTLSASVKPNVLGDTGLVFNVNRGTKKFFWEDEVSYYFFFVSQAGSAYLGKVEEGSWKLCGETAISSFTLDKTYNLSVSLDATNPNKTIINCFLNDEFLYSYKDDEFISGFEFGVRLGSINNEISNVTLSKDFKEEVVTMFGDSVVASGKWGNIGGKTTAKSGNSMLFNKENNAYGTFETTMRLLGTPGCNGIIFGLDNNDLNRFWEGGISYYFFFLDENGTARLSKVNMGVWTDLSISTIVTGFSNTGTFTLKVVRDVNVISCYVDNVKYIDFVDDVPLMGQYYGLRAQCVGTSFTPLVVTKGEDVVYKAPTNFDVVSGEMVTSNEVSLISVGNNTLALHKTIVFEEGTISAKVVENCNKSCGLIFRASEDGKSYYKFAIEGNYAKLSKVENDSETALTNKQFITASHTLGSTETIYVSIQNTTIRCYVRGILYAICSDSALLTGTKAGLYSQGKSSMFSGFEYSSDVKHDTCDTLMFGHSYMELWRNWKTDFSDYGSVINAGIGGSQASDWKDFVEEICDYGASTGIFMIGINDLTKYTNNDGASWFSGATPTQVGQTVRLIFDYIENNCPSMTQLALVSCNRCNAREYANIPDDIAELNAIFKTIANDYAWVHYADIDNAFLDGSGTPKSSCFIDNLHPTDEAYLVIKQAIDKALGKDN